MNNQSVPVIDTPPSALPVAEAEGRPGSQTLDETAHAIHAAYSEHVAKVDYKIFLNCWMKAARLVLECHADPNQFVLAQKGRFGFFDPEDLATFDSVEAFHRFEFDQARALIEEYCYSKGQFYNASMNAALVTSGVIYSPMIGLQPSFLVVQAKLSLEAEVATRIFEIYAILAAGEIRSSKLFRQYIGREHPQLNIDTLLVELDRVAATRDGQTGGLPAGAKS